MRIGRVLSIGLLLLSGCSATSPFSTTNQQPVPIAAQIGQGPPATAASMAAAPQQQFRQTGPTAYTQTPPSSGNPFLAGLKSTSETIGNAFTIQPRVIPASSPTSLSNPPANVGAELHFQAAQVYEGQQNTSGAILHYQKALETAPSDPKILVGFGRLYDRQNDLVRAEGLYQQALQVDPNHCPALNAMGICYAKQGNLDAALAHIAKAAELQPQNPRYRNNMANVLADAGRLEEAYSQLVAAHGPANAHYNLGYLLVQQGKLDLARRELDLALQANPRLEQATTLLRSLEPTQTPEPTLPASTEVRAPGRYSVSEPLRSPTLNPAATAPYGEEQGPRSLPPL